MNYEKENNQKYKEETFWPNQAVEGERASFENNTEGRQTEDEEESRD